MHPFQRLRIPIELIRFLARLPPTLKSKVRASIDAILSNPDLGKPLRAELLGLRSLRIGRFRIIYRHLSGIIEIAAVGPRSSVYQDLAQKLRRASRRS